MKYLYIILIIAFSFSANAQEKVLWNFGAEKGYAWLQGEVQPENGLGFGFYVDKPFTSYLSARLNVGIGMTQGLDKELSNNWLNHPVWNGTRNSNLNYQTASSDSVNNNFQTSYQEASLQGVFTFTQLAFFKNKTPFDAFIMGGIGLMRYSVMVDAADLNNEIYEFAILQSQSQNDDFQKTSNLRALMDGKYESSVTDNTQITPLFQVGGGLRWQINTNIQLSLAHRVSFTTTDDLDSYKWDASNQLNNVNDIHHYTTIGLTYTLRRKAKPIEIIPVVEPIIEKPIIEKVDTVIQITPIEEQVDTPVVVEDKMDEIAKEIVKKAFDNLEFETAKAVIARSSNYTLNELAELLKAHPEWELRIAGHTDNVGNAASNMELSRRRAQAVKRYLVKQGIKENRFIVTWFGEEKPIADNKTKEGRQKNRRVELEIID